MAFPFYILDTPAVSNVGFRFSGTTWTQFAPPLSHITTPNAYVRALAAVPAEPLLVYMIRGDVNALMSSTDGGASWTETTMPTLPRRLSESAMSLWAEAPGDVYLFNHRPEPGSVAGIWHTVNGGVTWAHIISLPCPAFTTAGGYMCLGINKLFYAELTSQVMNPPASSEYDYLWSFKRANLDGSGIETWATHTFSTIDNKDPLAILLRAVSDDFVLAAANVRDSIVADDEPQGVLWKIDATGITDVRPAAILSPWDLMPLTATRWLAVGTTQTADDVLVYRTDNAGTSWSLMTTIPDMQGFATSGYQDEHFMLSAPRPSVPDEVVMMGYASDTVQQNVWTSADGGATWTSMLNTADPFDGVNWAVTATGGLAAVCSPVVSIPIPSRLAAIVG